MSNGDLRSPESKCVCCEECSNDCTEDGFGPCLRRCVCHLIEALEDEADDDEYPATPPTEMPQGKERTPTDRPLTTDTKEGKT